MRFARRTALLLGFVLPFGSHAETFQDTKGNTWEISGFVKVEATRASETPRQISPNDSLYKYDQRNAFVPVPSNPTLGSRSSSLALQQLALGYSHETEGAVTFEARASYRWRSTADLGEWFSASDVSYRSGKGLANRDWFEKFIGVSRPDLGFVRYGTQLSRTWARSDSFSYPIGLANQWAGTGAGFSVMPEALRLTSKPFEDGIGKLTFEVSLGRDRLNTDIVQQNRLTQSNIAYQPGATEPRLVELFLQYSRERHLIEFTLQNVTGARQSSFGKAPLVGIAGVRCYALEDWQPDSGGDGGGITGGAHAEYGVIKVAWGSRGVAGAVVPAVPDGKRGLIPADVAGAIQEVGTVAADGGAGLAGEGVVRGDVLPEDPGLEHGAGFVVTGTLGEAGGDDDDGGAVEQRRALVEDSPVGVWHGGEVRVST